MALSWLKHEQEEIKVSIKQLFHFVRFVNHFNLGNSYTFDNCSRSNFVLLQYQREFRSHHGKSWWTQETIV